VEKTALGPKTGTIESGLPEHIGLTIDEAAYMAIRKLSPELQ
jgi:hypothetical protein